MFVFTYLTLQTTPHEEVQQSHVWRLGSSRSFGLILTQKKLLIIFYGLVNVDTLPCPVENK
jgi:hypothetical protein